MRNSNLSSCLILSCRGRVSRPTTKNGTTVGWDGRPVPYEAIPNSSQNRDLQHSKTRGDCHGFYTYIFFNTMRFMDMVPAMGINSPFSSRSRPE